MISTPERKPRLIPLKKARQLKAMKQPHKRLPGIPHAEYDGRPGRPSKLTAAMLSKIEMTCKLTVKPSYAFIAECVGISTPTFQAWLENFIGLRERIDTWRAKGIELLRTKAYAIAKDGDGKMLRYLLDRREPDFKPMGQLDVNDVTPNHDKTAVRPDFI